MRYAAAVDDLEERNALEAERDRLASELEAVAYAYLDAGHATVLLAHLPDEPMVDSPAAEVKLDEAVALLRARAALGGRGCLT